MKYIITVLFSIFTFVLNAQTSDSTISFKAEFYLNNTKQNLDEIEIQIIHISSEPNGFHDQNTEIVESTDTLERGDDILVSKSTNSITIKRGQGSFKLIVKYKNYIDSASLSHSYFQYGGHVVIGIVTDLKQFRKKVYKKHKLLEITEDEKTELENLYPYLTVSDMYTSYSHPSLFYVATRMDTEWGEGTWWGTSSRLCKIE